MMVGEEPSRREVLGSIGASASIGTLPDLASAQPAKTRQEVTIEERQLKTQQKARQEGRQAASSELVSDLSGMVEFETDFSLAPSESISISIETDDDDLNKRDPTILHVPLKPNKGFFHPDRGGVLLAITAQNDGRREVISSLAVTREAKPSFISHILGTNGQVEMKLFGEKKSNVGLVKKTYDSRYRNEHLSAQPDNREMIGPDNMIADVSCFTCTSVMEIACASFSYIGYEACMSAALSAGAFGPWAFTAATAFCAYIVANANTLSCAAGPPVICASAGACP